MTSDNELKQAYAEAASELARSARPVLEAVGRLIDMPVEKVGGLLAWAGEGLGSFLSDAGAIVGDRVRYWKLGNRVRMIEKVRDLGVDPKDLDQDWATRVVSVAEEESQDELLELWARLTVASGSGEEHHPGFITILRSISVDESTALRSGLDVSDLGDPNPFVQKGPWKVRTRRRGTPPPAPAKYQHLVVLGVLTWEIFSLPRGLNTGKGNVFIDAVSPLTYEGRSSLSPFGVALRNALGLDDLEFRQPS